VTATTAIISTSTVCAGAVPTFAIQISGSDFNGQYLFSSPYIDNSDLASGSPSISTLSQYSLTGTVLAEYNGNVLSYSANVISTVAKFYTAADASSDNYVPFQCKITNSQLTCMLGTATQAVICDVSGAVLVFVEPDLVSTLGCPTVVLNVVPLCVL
jgi:hypothetical protein